MPENEIDKRNELAIVVDLPYYVHQSETPDQVDRENSKTRAIRRSLAVVSFEMDEAVNSCYRLEIVASLDGGFEDLSDRFLLQSLALRVEWRDKTAPASRDIFTLGSGDAAFPSGRGRNFSGRVAECHYLGDSYVRSGDRPDKSFYRFIVRPTFWFMAQRPRIRTFLNKDVKEILKEALEDYKKNADREKGVLPVEFDLDNVKAGADADKKPLFEKREFVLQYNETDEDFITRWLERQGWWYYFQFAGIRADADGLIRQADYVEEKLVVVSDNRLLKVGGGDDEFLHFSNRSSSGLGLYSLVSKNANIPSQVVVRDHNPDDPDRKLEVRYPAKPEANALPPRILDGEFFATESEGKAVAKTRSEGVKAMKTVFHGRTNLAGLFPGCSYYPHSDAAAADRWAFDAHLVVRVRHTAAVSNPEVMVFLENIGMDRPAVGYFNSFESVRFENRFHCPKSRPMPAITAPVKGWVMHLTDNSSATRDQKYYVRILGVENHTGGWGESGSAGPMRAVVGKAGINSGSADPIPAGVEVVVEFHDGNPDRPFISGQLRDAQTVLPATNGLKTEQDLDGNQTIQSAIGTLTTSLSSVEKTIRSTDSATSLKDVENSITTLKATDFNLMSSRFIASFSVFRNSVVASTDRKNSASVLDYLSGALLAALNVGDAVAPDTSFGKIVSEVSSYQTKILSLFKYITTASQVHALKNEPARMVMNVEPKTTTLTEMATIPGKMDIFLLLLDYVFELTNIIAQETKLIQENRLAVETHQKNFNAEKTAGDNPDSSGWREPAWKLPVAFDATLALADAVMFVKALYNAYYADESIFDKGICISAYNPTTAEQTQINTLEKTVKKAAKEAWKAVKKTAGDREQGYDIQILADGPLIQRSDRRVTLESARKLQLAKTLPGHVQIAPETLGRIEIVGGNPDARAADEKISKITASAQNIAADAGVDLTMTAANAWSASVVAAGVKKYAHQADANGDCEINGEGQGNFIFNNALTMQAKTGAAMLTGKSVVVGAAGKGVVIGSLSADGKTVEKGKPQISVNDDIAKSAAIPGKTAELQDAIQKYNAERAKFLDALGKWQTAEADANQAQAAGATNYLVLQQKATMKKNTRDSAKTAMDNARKEVTTARSALDKANAQMNASQELVLSNGDNASQKIVLAKNNVTLISDKKIVMQDKNASVALTVDLGGKSMTAKVGTGKFKIDAATINLA